MLTFEGMKKHIFFLAKELKCQVRLAENQPGMMYVEFGYVEGPTIRTQFDYFVNLHELGHVFYGHTQGRPPKTNDKFYFTNGVLKSEAEAWDYALSQAQEEPSSETRELIWSKCLGSYLNSAKRMNGRTTRLWNGNRYYVEFVYDEPDDYFKKVANRIKKGVMEES